MYINMVNGGVTFVRSNNRTITMYQKWLERATVHGDDQQVGTGV